MARTFLFVDAFKDDKATRSRARSHVLKGKNAGRKFDRRSKNQLDRSRGGKPDTAVPKSKDRVMCTSKSNIARERNQPSGPPSQPFLALRYCSLNDHLYDFAFPVADPLRSQCVIRQCILPFHRPSIDARYLPLTVCLFVLEAIYPPRLCESLHKPRAYWLQSCFQDEMSTPPSPCCFS